MLRQKWCVFLFIPTVLNVKGIQMLLSIQLLHWLFLQNRTHVNSLIFAISFEYLIKLEINLNFGH